MMEFNSFGVLGILLVSHLIFMILYLGFAMICESVADQLSVTRLDQPLDYCNWSGHPPPLLRLAIVDLALPRASNSDSIVSMFIDPLIPERIYCLHDGGVDSIVLHFLPFMHQTSGRDENDENSICASICMYIPGINRCIFSLWVCGSI